MKKLLFLALTVTFTGIYADYDIVDREPVSNTESFGYPVNQPYSTYGDRELVGNPTYSDYETYPGYRGGPIRRTAQDAVSGAEEVVEAPLNLLP